MSGASAVVMGLSPSEIRCRRSLLYRGTTRDRNCATPAPVGFAWNADWVSIFNFLETRRRANPCMARKCPACISLNVRRSSFRTAEVTARHIFLSPYRCRDCGERFWVVSRNAYFLAGVIGGSLLAGAIGWHAWELFDRVPRVEPAQAAVEASQLTELMKRAEAEDPAAEHELGRMHATGDGVPKDEQKAWKWLERSARHGNVQAQYDLAIALRDGRGTIQDYDGALNWMIKSAEGGNPQAQFDLANMYRVGTGVTVDNVKAYIWLNLAAAQGLPGAAPLRDAVLSRLSPDEVVDAQTEARRLGEVYRTRPSAAP